MKNVFPIILVAFCIQSVFAQKTNTEPFKNYISFQLTQPIFGEYQVGYERLISPKYSIELNASFQPIRDAEAIRSPGFGGSLQTEVIFPYQRLRWAKFNQSFMFEAAFKRFLEISKTSQIYLSGGVYYRNCSVRNGNWHFMTPKSMYNQYWITTDIDTDIVGARAIWGSRWVANLDYASLFFEFYTGLGVRMTFSNVFYHKFEERINPNNNKYNYSERYTAYGLTLHLGAKVGICF